MTGDSLEVLGSRWGPKRRGAGRENSRGSEGEMERQTNWKVSFPACKSGSLLLARAAAEEVYWRGGENHAAQGMCGDE